MLEKIKRVLILASLFLFTSYVFNRVSDYLDKEKLKNFKYTNSRIENFVIVSKKLDSQYKLYGTTMVDLGEKLYIEKPFIVYLKDSKSFELKGEYSYYLKDKKIAEIYRNVNFESKDIKMLTDKLFIDSENKIAYNNSKVFITSENMDIYGKDLFFNFDEEILKLNQVETRFKRKS